ncbi:MAG: GNAT family N-acetyltransferase [Actinomycetota bacterium]|nr:GNAT family N-acetyltransferase [Actinomycetota bacterium]
MYFIKQRKQFAKNKKNYDVGQKIGPGSYIMDNLNIIKGLPSRYRLQLAHIYFEVFGSKVRMILGSKPIILKFMTEALNIKNGYYALKGPRLVGFLGFESQVDAYSDFSYRNLRKVFNPCRAYFLTQVCRLAAYRGLKPGQILIDTFAVLPGQREQGIGTLLFKAFEKFAMHNGYSQILLEVIDTNSEAIKLYRRLGFEPVGIRRYFVLSRFLGFSASITMAKQL